MYFLYLFDAVPFCAIKEHLAWFLSIGTDRAWWNAISEGIKISGKSNITFSHIQNASGWFFEIFWLGRILYFISKWKLIFILCIPNLGPFWDSQILYFLKSCARKVETFIMANCIKSCVPNSNRQKSVTVTLTWALILISGLIWWLSTRGQ